MIREYLGKKAADKIERTRFGGTRVGRISTVILDDGRLEDIGSLGLTSLGHNLHDPRSRTRVLAWAAITNLLSWLTILLIPKMVSKLVFAFGLLLPKGGAVLLAPTFGFTLMGVYALLRRCFPERSYGPDDGPVMQSYGRDSESLLTRRLWLVSCGIAGINTILLAAAYLVMTGEYEWYDQVGVFPWSLYI
jgi:hypothetical protein